MTGLYILVAAFYAALLVVAFVAYAHGDMARPSRRCGE